MKTENLNTDELFEALPNFINVEGELYHFSLIKGSKRIIIDYTMNKSEGGKSLCQTYWSGKTIKEALKNCLDWLIKFDYNNKKSENILLDMIKSIEKKNTEYNKYIHNNWKELYPEISEEQSLECEKRASNELGGKDLGSLDEYLKELKKIYESKF